MHNRHYEKIGNFEPKCIEDELPFDIPDGWRWVRLGCLATIISGVSYDKNDVCESGIRILRGGNINNLQISIYDNDVFLPSNYYDNEKQVRINDIIIVASTGSKGDILLTKVGTTGIPALVNTDIPFSLFVSVALIKFNKARILPDYFIYLLKSPLVQNQAAENTRGVGNKNWVLSDIEKTLLAIPPFAEQKRIVDKINEIFSKL